MEIATIFARKPVARAISKVLLDLIDLGTTVSEVRVDAVYRYHVEMARARPLRIFGKACQVRAGAVRPTLPVAFDSANVERRISSGWARLDKRGNSPPSVLCTATGHRWPPRMTLQSFVQATDLVHTP